MTTAANVCPRCRSELRVYEDGDTDCPKCGWTPSPKASARAEPPPILASPFDAHVQAQQKLLEQLQMSLASKQKVLAKTQQDIKLLEGQIVRLKNSLKELGKPVKAGTGHKWTEEQRQAARERMRRLNEERAKAKEQNGLTVG